MSTYASGEAPQIGDKVFCIRGDVDFLTEGAYYTVRAIYNRLPDLQEVFISEEDDLSWSTSRFQLIHRKDIVELLDESITEKLNKPPLKLHLGCYNKKIHNFINVDIRPEVNADVTDDCMKLTKFENNSVDLIYTSHMMEHTTRQGSMEAFKRYYEVLKSGGEIYISVPDLEMVFRHYILHQDLRLLQNFLYGSQKHVADYHLNGWDFKTLKEDLESVGFRNVERYDTWATDWGYVDDYSKAYLPHMDFENGTLMSLNVKATK